MENYWYFATREGTDIGPYPSRDDAHGGLGDFIQFIQLANEATLKAFYSALNIKQSDTQMS